VDEATNLLPTIRILIQNLKSGGLATTIRAKKPPMNDYTKFVQYTYIHPQVGNFIRFQGIFMATSSTNHSEELWNIKCIVFLNRQSLAPRPCVDEPSSSSSSSCSSSFCRQCLRGAFILLVIVLRSSMSCWGKFSQVVQELRNHCCQYSPSSTATRYTYIHSAPALCDAHISTK
jgi:hypothetical protein